MKPKIRRPARICIVFAAAVLCAVAIVFVTPLHTAFAGASKSVKVSKQSDYPTLPPPARAETMDETLAQQVDSSCLIVDATVLKVLPETSETYTPQSGSFESKVDQKTGRSYYTIVNRPVQLGVNETLTGTPLSRTITMYIGPFALDCSPAFKPGDRLVFLLRSSNGKYYGATLQQSYFYISGDSKIYPAVVTDKLKGYSGMDAGKFKREIKADVRGKK